MRKKLTFCFAIMMAVVSFGLVHAQPEGYYKKFYINQNFDLLEALPTGWTSTNSFGYAGGFSLYAEEDGNKSIRVNISGSGARGGEINFPTPQANMPDYDAEKTTFLEVDWTPQNVVVNWQMANLFLIGGSNGVNMTRPKAEWYMDGILGLYTFGDGFLYYWNKDLQGPETAIPGEFYGPVFINGEWGASFERTPAVEAKRPEDIPTDIEGTKTLNAPNKTNVAFAAGTTYHIVAELDFANQKIVSLTITDKENPENTETITDMPFLASSLAGGGYVIPEDYAGVKDVSYIACAGNRRGTTNIVDVKLDNIEVYQLQKSLGRTTITVNYIDQDGNSGKEARVTEEMEIGIPFTLTTEDKSRFSNNGFYYAYDAEATHKKNTEYSDGETITVAKDASITVVFKKTAKTDGEYIWKGSTNEFWSELDDNFSVNGGAPIAYQAGNPVVFEASASVKEVVLKGALDLKDANVTVEAEGYTFTNAAEGVNRIEGTGQFIVSAAASVGIDNRLPELVVSGTSPLTITATTAAQKIILKSDKAELSLKTAGTLSMPIEYDASIVDGTLTVNVLSEATHAMPFTNVSTLNVNLAIPGRVHPSTATWTTTFSSATPYDNMRINANNICESYVFGEETFENPIVGFSITEAVAVNAHIHLGDNVRLVRNYNEVSGGTSVTQIGALSGTANSKIHVGWVPDRAASIQVGNLNIDTQYEGTIEKYYLFNRPDSLIVSKAAIIKVGTGKWTLNGDQILDNGITVNGGELELLGDIFMAAGNVIVNDGGTLTVGGKFGELYGDIVMPTTSTTVNQGGTLKGLRGNQIKSIQTTVNAGGTLVGDLNFDYSVSMDTGIPAASEEEVDIPASVWKPFVTSFNEGDFDKMVVEMGDGAFYGDLNVTVDSAKKGEKIQLIQGNGNLDVAFGKIIVNGVDITNFTEATANAQFVWFPDTFELLSMADKKGSNIEDINTGKEIQNILYYDLSGRQVTKDAKGFVIQKIIYTDDTFSVKKTYLHELR